MNFVFISPTFPDSYYQFPKALKAHGVRTLGIGEDSYDSLDVRLKEALDEYYRVDSLEDYDQVFKAVAYFTWKHGKIDWLESNNEYWLVQDEKLRTDFNITTGYNNGELHHCKYKSAMKEFYVKAGIPVARHHMVTTLAEGKKFIKEVGYPVCVKPDNGVGASATYKLKNDTDLKNFYETKPDVQYIMEEFVTGEIISYDGIVGPNSEVIFETSHYFPKQIMDVVNGAEEDHYYSLREIPEGLKEAGRKAVASFKPRSRFFHFEFFKLTEAKKGLGEVGDFVGLEVNMRPPGGYTPDMMNFANDIDVYDIYAQMVTTGTAQYSKDRPYYCIYVGKRDGLNYKENDEAIYNKYGDNIMVQGRMPDILADALGNNYFIARFAKETDVNKFAKFVYAKKK